MEILRIIVPDNSQNSKNFFFGSWADIVVIKANRNLNKLKNPRSTRQSLPEGFFPGVCDYQYAVGVWSIGLSCVVSSKYFGTNLQSCTDSPFFRFTIHHDPLDSNGIQL